MFDSIEYISLTYKDIIITFYEENKRITVNLTPVEKNIVLEEDLIKNLSKLGIINLDDYDKERYYARKDYYIYDYDIYCDYCILSDSNYCEILNFKYTIKKGYEDLVKVLTTIFKGSELGTLLKNT
ncbi:hypothetical protein [Clostridium sp. D53t1_180928_C8]|uniref:hypothetical protein n=1 Tax=Clostridium sp. D53t1_180928_C8 TaxID=2787101 RepID=UPI0018A90EE6|nr:hypothetical protein [Clostridium sp. D53t1_180928_C8]